MDNHASNIPANAQQFKIKDFTAFLYKVILGIFLPLNTMSVVQPVNQGIIACFKRKWWAKLVSWLLEKAGQGWDKLGHLASPDVKQAMLWVRDVLRDIPEEVVKNCWRKAGILRFEVN